MNLSIFNTASLFESATDLFKQLNIRLNSNTSESLPVRDLLKGNFREADIFKSIRNTYFIGIIDDSIFKEVGLFDESYSYKEALKQADKSYEGLMFFALELNRLPNRTEISDLTRAFNRISQKMPVALLLKYMITNEAVISISISERFKYKQNWRQGEKAGKVIILRDIHTINTHAGHYRILNDLVKPIAATNYAQLHEHWLQVLDVSILNKRFFQELANWYFWAMEIVEFPDDVEKDKELRNATNLIRLITRIIFIWFIKEKKLVPNNLFRKEYLSKILVDFAKSNKSEDYYHAILQNLFFGTLNQKIEDRSFVKEGTYKENKAEYGVKNLFRYGDKFKLSEKEIIEIFRDIPFLNGGLFDCLDRPNEDGKIIYVDGFSRNAKKQAHIPDYVFFCNEQETDLNEIYGTINKRYKVLGLINLLESYKFTIAENTPIEEEIALDPELLGKVFENLLASYNPETKTTARKQTGSFYTPREIVNYMVDETLKEYLKESCGYVIDDFDNRINDLISYSENPNPFDLQETRNIIEALNNCKILDPACGSGAFPMGILHKMVHLLNKLDSGNKFWKDLQKKKAIEETKSAYEINDHLERKRRLDEIDDVFENNMNDYGRKLFLIENCIYGIDIQPIAVQIAKLRFFISLIIDQKRQEANENFGIRSLPNLETKFVAANSLISLEKPQLKTGDIFLNETYTEINILSNQLKETRHNYFNAKVRSEKLKFQKKDKDLRKKISTLLVKIGHTTINAHNIAAFDPYDQNHFADWFEPEWMFGSDVMKGFDIVLGNPPYISTRTKDFDSSYKDYFKENYSLAVGQYDLFTLFIEKSNSLIKEKGVLSFIVPKKLLTNENFEVARRFLLKNLPVINYVDTQMPFEAASVEANVIVSTRKSVEKVRTNIFNGDDILFKYEVDCKLIDLMPFKIFPFAISPQNVKVIDSIIKKCSKCFGDYLLIMRGMECGFNHPSISTKKSKYKIVKGEHISKYKIHETEWYVKPDFSDTKIFKAENIYLKTPKLLTKFVSNSIDIALDDYGYFNTNVIYNIHPKLGFEHLLKYFLALGNSKLINFWFFNTYVNDDKIFPHIQKNQLDSIPVIF